MNSFNLCNYLDEIRAISQNCKCTVTAAVDRMCVNLDTFNEYNRGTGTLNYHALSNQWGMLTSAQKVDQKREAKKLVSESAHSTRVNRRRV